MRGIAAKVAWSVKRNLGPNKEETGWAAGGGGGGYPEVEAVVDGGGGYGVD